MGRRLLLTLAVVGIVASAFWYFQLPQAPLATPSPTPSAPTVGCHFEPGDRMAFRLATEVDASASGPSTAKDHFNAVLSWQVLEIQRPGQWLIRAAFSSADLVQVVTPATQRVAQPLDSSFLLRVGSDCRFEAKGYSSQWLPTTRRFVSSVLSAFEFGVSSAGPSWDFDQTDGLGRFTASYQARRLSEGTLQVTRKKHRYRQEGQASSMGFEAQVLVAVAKATLEPSGRWLQTAQGEERVRLKAKSAVLADLTQRFSLTRDESAFVLPQAGDHETQVDWQDPFLMPTPPQEEAPSQQMVTLSLDDALKQFEKLYRQKAKGDAYAAALMLAQWLRAHPESAAAVLLKIRSGDIVEAMRPAVFLALEQCGTPQARTVLSSALADKSLSEMDRARASSALSDVPKPTQESAQSLASAARLTESKLVSGTSVRALGHLVGRSDVVSPEIQAEMTQVLKGELSKAQDISRTVDVVDAIGNTGNGQFAPDLKPYLANASESMREHAVRAMRKMPSPQVAPLLLDRLGHEPEPSVRVAIVETLLSLGVRDAATMGSVAQWLSAEPVPQVRAAMIQWLGSATAELPEAKAALVTQFHKETVPQLMQLIGQYVSAEDLR